MIVSTSLLISILVVFAILLRAKSKQQVFCWLLSFVLIVELNRISSTAMVIGGREIGIEDIPLAVLAIVALWCVSKEYRISKPLLIAAIAFYAVCVASLLVNVLFPADTLVVTSSWDDFYLGRSTRSASQIGLKSYLSLIRLLIFVIVLCAAAACMRRSDYQNISDLYLRVSKFHIGFALFELANKYFFESGISLYLARLFLPDYGQSVVTVVFQRGGLYALQGLTREPAHFAMAMFFYVVVFILAKRSARAKSAWEYTWPALAFVLMVVSASFSSLVYAFAIVVVVLLSHMRMARVRIGHTIVLGFAIFACLVSGLLFVGLDPLADTFYGEKLHHTIVSLPALFAGDYSSIEFMHGGGTSRLISIVETVRVFLENPILGVGPGVTGANSVFVTMLANYGLVGTCAWLVMLLQYVQNPVRGKTGRFICFVMLFAIILGGDNMIYSTFWVLSVALFAYLPIQERVGAGERNEGVLFGRAGQGSTAARGVRKEAGLDSWVMG